MSGKIKILYTIPNFDTAGSGKALLKIAQRLNSDLFEPHICCNHDQGKFFAVVRESGITVHLTTYTTPMIPRIKGLVNAWKISRFFKRQKFDLIHSFHYSDDYSEGLAAKLAGVKWIFTKKNMNWGGNSWQMRSKFASGIVAQNTDMIREFYPDKKNVELIGRGVDTSEFKVLPPSQTLREEFNLSSDSRVILTVANLVPVKGIEFLIEGFQLSGLAEKNCKLFVVGDDDNEYGITLQQKAEHLGVADKVIFTGKRMEVNQFQSIADLFVLPTLNKGRQEGSPVSLLEAMACGSPVIASNIAGIRDQLSTLPDQLFEPANSQEIAAKLNLFLAKSKEEIEDIKTRQFEVIQQYYTIEREVEAHEKFYLKICKRN